MSYPKDINGQSWRQNQFHLIFDTASFNPLSANRTKRSNIFWNWRLKG